MDLWERERVVVCVYPSDSLTKHTSSCCSSLGSQRSRRSYNCIKQTLNELPNPTQTNNPTTYYQVPYREDLQYAAGACTGESVCVYS